MTGAARRAAGRQAAALLVAAGTIALLGAPVVGEETGHPVMLAALGLFAGAIGAVAWLLPWDRWPDQALDAVGALLLVLIAAGNAAGGHAPYTYGISFVVVFAWIGLHRPPRTAVLLIPLATITYLVPLLVSTHQERNAWPSVILVVPVCVLVGEAISRAMEGLRQSRLLDTRRVGDLEAIVGAAALLQAETEPHDVGPMLARVATGILHGEDAVVLLEDGDGGRITAGVHPGALDEDAVVLPPGDLVDDVLREGQALVRDSTLVLPLRGANRILGAVAVRFAAAARPDSFTVHAAQLFGSQAGVALEQQRVIEELTAAAMQDALTGVGNRRRAALLLDELRPDDAVVLIDLDHFKLINDTSGHAGGDRVLVQLGRYLKEAARGVDAIARYGGEEFLLVLRQAGESATAATTRVLEGWRAQRPLTTFSAGVAVHRAGRSPAATLGRADAALYRAKRNGRDRVCEDAAEETV